MIYRRIFLTIITSLSYCLSFASYDGRLADDPYHKSPTWLYLVIFIAVVCGIVKAISKKKGNYTNVQKSKAKKYKKNTAKVYQETGLHWDECPSCKGRGWIDGKEISYIVAPPETVCCDQCKGYGHQLTPDAELLHVEYCKQYNEEQTIARSLRIQKEKERAEEQKRLSEERWKKKQQAIANIKSAGRRVLKEDEYLKNLEELRAKRKELGKKIISMLECEPLCTSCQDGNIKKDCPVCRGTGHIPTSETKDLIDEVLALSSTIKQLWSDYRALYPQDMESGISISSVESLVNMFSGTEKNNPPKSSLIRERIVKLLKDEPYCPHCMAAGHLRVITDYATNKAYEQVVCPCCKGQGRLYYNVK